MLTQQHTHSKQVRNSGIRTLFLAVGGQASRFDAHTWHHCLWEILFPLIQVWGCGGCEVHARCFGVLGVSFGAQGLTHFIQPSTFTFSTLLSSLTVCLVTLFLALSLFSGTLSSHIQYAHVMGDLSSSEEAAAVELGKEKGKAVMMLVHHSRNTEQKQW